MRYLLVLLGLLVANVANAIDCRENPDCVQMGYSTADDPNCLENGYISCPFDTAYKKCVNYKCEAWGFTTSDKSSWCNKLIKCKTDTSFTLCQNLCEVGDVYYADGSCGKAEKYEPKSSPKPIGVVYWLKDNGAHGKVINLKDLTRNSSTSVSEPCKDINLYDSEKSRGDGFNPADPYNNAYALFPWGVYNLDISDLENWDCANHSYVTIAKSGDHNNAFWSAGKDYTKIIATAQNNDLNYPAPAALAFYPPGVSPDDPKVGKGKWYLPTLGELMDLYGYNYSEVDNNCNGGSTGATGTTRATVNVTLSTLKGKGVGAEVINEVYYYSSMESHNLYSWVLFMKGGSRHPTSKCHINHVRVSLEF